MSHAVTFIISEFFPQNIFVDFLVFLERKKFVFRHSFIEFILVREMKSAYYKTESKSLHYCIEPRQKSVKFPFRGHILNGISTREIPQNLDELKILIQRDCEQFGMQILLIVRHEFIVFTFIRLTFGLRVNVI